MDPNLLLYLPGLLIGLSVHEFAHAWVAYYYGDSTGKMMGRVTLNPVAHIDPIGLICLLTVGFGWGKPVPVNSRFFRKPREASIAVSMAGIAANLIVILITAVLYGLLMRIAPMLLRGAPGTIIAGIIMYNAGLAVFNLLPLPPLDGSKALTMLLPYDLARSFANLSDQVGMMILMVLSFTGMLGAIISPAIRAVTSFAMGIATFIMFL